MIRRRSRGRHLVVDEREPVPGGPRRGSRRTGAPSARGGSGRTGAPAAAEGSRRTGALASALVIGLLGSGMLVWQGTGAVWMASTGNAANVWTAATVALSDNDAGTQLFTLTGLLPGDTGARCLQVSYAGTAPSVPVRLYAVNVTDAASLGSAIDLTVESGTYLPDASDPLNCTAGTFTRTGTLYDASHPVAGAGTLAAFAAAHTGYPNGLSVGPVTRGSPTLGFRFTYTLKATADPALQGTSATVGLQWETQSGT